MKTKTMTNNSLVKFVTETIISRMNNEKTSKTIVRATIISLRAMTERMTNLVTLLSKPFKESFKFSDSIKEKQRTCSISYQFLILSLSLKSL